VRRSLPLLAALAVVVVASIKAREKNVEKVTTAKAAKEELVSTVSCNGRIRARVKVDISSQVMGQIVTLAVREGDEVKKGDLLLQIDKAQYDANAQAQQAALDALFAQRESDRFTREQAERDFERMKKNYEAKIDSEQNLQKARLTLDSAIANERADERRIENARIVGRAKNHDTGGRREAGAAHRLRRHRPSRPKLGLLPRNCARAQRT